MLAFRDYLRTHPAEAAEYGRHKTRLAAKFAHDKVAYVKAKDAMVKGIIERAMQWKAQQRAPAEGS
jgi:GrpB-like predicted nucleotidyltransferase (UPF0157 family)